MADPLTLAQDYWDLAQSDPTILATLQTQSRNILLGIANGTATGDIVQAGKNGANYTQRINYSLSDRQAAMKWAIESIKSGIRPSRNQRVKFTSC